MRGRTHLTPCYNCVTAPVLKLRDSRMTRPGVTLPKSFGPRMRALTEKQRAFVLALLEIPIGKNGKGNHTEAARMDNAVKMLFRASKAEYVKPERESKKKRAKKTH